MNFALSMRTLFSSHTGISRIAAAVGVVSALATAAVAVPIVSRVASTTRHKLCRQNMQAIANEWYVYRVKDQSHRFTTNLSDLKMDGVNKLKCPDGDDYKIQISDGTLKAQSGEIIPSGKPLVSCGKDGVFALDIDSN